MLEPIVMYVYIKKYTQMVSNSTLFESTKQKRKKSMYCDVGDCFRSKIDVYNVSYLVNSVSSSQLQFMH